MKNTLRRLVSIVITTAWAIALLPLTSSQSDSAIAAPTEYNFAACIQDKGQAHVVLMMDESGSIYGIGGTTPSDPKNVRIAGAQILLDRLQEVADRYGKPVNVQLSGFGDNFVARPSAAWTAMEPNSQTSLKTLIDTSKNWAEANKIKNWRETDLVTAMAGARDIFLTAPAESCKLFVFFKDGADFHAFRDSQNPSPVADFEEIDSLLEDHKIDKADQAAINEICRDGGLADSLRADSNLYSIGVGISDGNNESEGFKKFKAVIEGVSTSGCKGGSSPAHGKYIRAKDISSLPGLFSDLLDPSNRAPTKTGNFYLDLKQALTGIRVLSAGVTSKSFTVVPPKSCSSPAQTFKASEGNKADVALGQGVTGTVSWLGDDKNLETISLVMKHAEDSTDKCWEGRWEFKPGEGAVSSLYFDADLQATAEFEADSPYVVPGDTKGTPYSIKLSRPSEPTGSILTAKSLDEDVSLTVNGFVRNAETKEIESTFTEFNVTGEQLEEGRLLIADGNQPFGKYELVLTLSVTVKDFTEQLMPITTQSTFEVRSAKAAPTIDKITNFGVLNGTERSKGTLTITGSPEEDYTLDLSKSESAIVANTFPEGIKYVFAFKEGEKQTFTVPKGKSISVDVWIKAAPISEKGDGEVRSRMPISGKLAIAVSPASEPNSVVAISGKFEAEQRASTNAFWRSILIIGFLILAALINFLAIRVISGFLTRTPDSKTWVQYKFGDVQFNDQGFVNLAGLRSSLSNQENFDDGRIEKDRKSVILGDQTARAVGSKLSLSHIGYMQLSGTPGSIGTSSNNPASPVLPLSLTSAWAFYLSPQSLIEAKNGLVATGTLVIVRLKQEQKTAGEVFDDFESRAEEFLTKQLEKVQAAPVGTPRGTYDWETPASGFAGEAGTAQQPKKSPFGGNSNSQPAPPQQNNNNLDQW